MNTFRKTNIKPRNNNWTRNEEHLNTRISRDRRLTRISDTTEHESLGQQLNSRKWLPEKTTEHKWSELIRTRHMCLFAQSSKGFIIISFNLLLNDSSAWGLNDHQIIRIDKPRKKIWSVYKKNPVFYIKVMFHKHKFSLNVNSLVWSIFAYQHIYIYTLYGKMLTE